MHILVKNNFLYFNDYKVKCAVGKSGIGNKKEEGDNITPKGTFKIKYILYRKDRLKRLKTKLNLLPIKENMGWCDDPKSQNYNKLIRIPSKYNFEKLFRTDNIYDVILVLNFNMNPIKKNKGSAIFLHIAKNNYQKTKGCLAIKKRDIIKIINYLKKESKIIIN